MIRCKLIDHSRYSLEEREKEAGNLLTDARYFLEGNTVPSASKIDNVSDSVSNLSDTVNTLYNSGIIFSDNKVFSTDNRCISSSNGTRSIDSKATATGSRTLLEDIKTPHVLLSTCNRVELYWGDGSVPLDIIRHLYRVSSGLESSLVGEKAIQSQIKSAYTLAIEKYRLSSSLNRLFQSAMHTGKRVRSETRISEGAVSHSQVTVELLRAEYTDLRKIAVSIIGVNKLTEDIMKYLVSRGAENIFLSNRNIERAREMASRYCGTAVSLTHKRQMISQSDILICASSAPHTLIDASDISSDKKITIFDLAFPRDVDNNVRLLSGVRLYNLEDIEHFARINLSMRNNETVKAETIIDEEIAKFYAWQNSSFLQSITQK